MCSSIEYNRNLESTLSILSTCSVFYPRESAATHDNDSQRHTTLTQHTASDTLSAVTIYRDREDSNCRKDRHKAKDVVDEQDKYVSLFADHNTERHTHCGTDIVAP